MKAIFIIMPANFKWLDFFLKNIIRDLKQAFIV